MVEDIPHLKKEYRCCMCYSREVYYARHDSDWGSGNSFTPLNDGLDDINHDIFTSYCASCGATGDQIPQLVIFK